VDEAKAVFDRSVDYMLNGNSLFLGYSKSFILSIQ